LPKSYSRHALDASGVVFSIVNLVGVVMAKALSCGCGLRNAHSRKAARAARLWPELAAKETAHA
jgi:hypothetical protein